MRLMLHSLSFTSLNFGVPVIRRIRSLSLIGKQSALRRFFKEDIVRVFFRGVFESDVECTNFVESSGLRPVLS